VRLWGGGGGRGLLRARGGGESREQRWDCSPAQSNSVSFTCACSSSAGDGAVTGETWLRARKQRADSEVQSAAGQHLKLQLHSCCLTYSHTCSLHSHTLTPPAWRTTAASPGSSQQYLSNVSGIMWREVGVGTMQVVGECEADADCRHWLTPSHARPRIGYCQRLIERIAKMCRRVETGKLAHIMAAFPHLLMHHILCLTYFKLHDAGG
jgi:hypothetical protein